MLRKVVEFGALIAAAALLSGCGSDTFSGETRLFPKSSTLLSSPDWSKPSKSVSVDLGNNVPVAPEELIDANGACAANASATASGDAAVGTVAGDLGSAASAPQAAPAAPLVAGGVALGMTECDVARRAGQPGQVNIGADAGSERKVVLTYQSGPWPGIYTFVGGRLKEVDRVATPEPVKPVKKNAKPKKPKTAAAPPSETFG